MIVATTLPEASCSDWPVPKCLIAERLAKKQITWSDLHPDTLFWHGFWMLLTSCLEVYTAYNICILYIYIWLYMYILTFLPAFYLAFILTYFLAYILTFCLTFFLASILTFCLAFFLAFGSHANAPQHPELAIWCSGPGVVPHSIWSLRSKETDGGEWRRKEKEELHLCYILI